MGQLGDKRAVDPLINALADDEYQVRQAAAEALGQLGDKRAVDPLIKALVDGHSDVRKAAAEALGQLGDVAVDPLTKILLDDNSDIRRSAAEALGQLGDKRAVDPLINALADDEYWVRQAAAEALGQLGDKRAVDPLIKALVDGHSDVRKAAVKALVQLGDVAVDPLIEAMEDDNPSVHQAAAEALEQLGQSKWVQDYTAQDSDNPIVVIDTSMGTITAELWADRAPQTVANLLAYIDDQFYDGLILHRVISDFMIQGGGMDAGMKQKATRAPLINEATAELRNDRGTLAMARTSDVNSATAQFFINLVDNDFLNHRDETARGFGYCAFGCVTEGLDVVDQIGSVATGRSGSHDDVPVEPVVINSIRRA